jgi:hypothetical protein
VIAFEDLQSFNNNSLHNRTKLGKTPGNKGFHQVPASPSAAGSEEFVSLLAIGP